MKKLNKTSLIIGIIIGVLITSVSVYAAITAFAGNIRFTPSDNEWNVSNVSEALEDLYELANRKEYGVRRKINNSLSAWERIGASYELEANAQVGEFAVRNDFDNIYPWSEIKSYNYNTDTKEIVAWYGDNNFSFKPNGNIEVLTYIPEFYYKRYQKDGYEYVFITEKETEGYLKSESFSIARYTMSLDKSNSSRVHSKSGEKPLDNRTITQFRNLAKNIGEGFQQLDYHIFIIQLLYLVEYADYDSQAKLGPGVSGYESGHGAIASGGCDKLGMHSGSADGTNKTSIIYRGIEDIFGNIWQFVDGINIKDYIAYINYDPTTYEVDTFNGNYKKVGYINSSNQGTYTSKLGYDSNHPLVAFPIESLGSSTTHMTDYYWTSSGNRIVMIGGLWYESYHSGLWNLGSSQASSYSDSHGGARLIKLN